MGKTDINVTKRTLGVCNHSTRQIFYRNPGYDLTISSDKTTYSTEAGSTKYADSTKTIRNSSSTTSWYSITRAGGRKLANSFSFSKDKFNFITEQGSHSSYDSAGRLSQVITDSGYTQNSPSETINGTVWYNPVVSAVPQSMSDAARSKIATRARLKVKDEKVNIQQFLAERDQTIRLVTDAVKSVTDVVKNLKKGNFPGAFRAVGIHLSPTKHKKLRKGFARDQTKAIANAWIGLQYGVRPLLDDVRGAAESLAKLHTRLPPVQRAEAREVVHYSIMSSGTVNPGDYPRKFVNLSEVTQEHKYVIYYRSSPTVSSLPTSLGLTNPASIVWELTPWSFVVDWFFPVGDYLSSLDATVGVDFVDGSYTVFTRTKAIRNFDWNAKIGSTSYTIHKGFGNSSYEGISCQRTKLTSFPMPSLPTIKNPLSTGHMLNAMALLRQQFR